jgi:hypothetical protein
MQPNNTLRKAASKARFTGGSVSMNQKGNLFRFAAAPYQPIDAKANRKNWKAGASDWAWGCVVTAPIAALAVAALAVAPLILGKCGQRQNC